MKILFLYSEVAGYFLSCISQYYKTYGGDLHVVKWPVNNEAPFEFKDDDGIKFYNRNEFTTSGLIQLADSIDPDVVYVTGWIDKEYLKVARKFKKAGKPVVAAFDGQWLGKMRQKIATVISPFFIQNAFSHAWIPGTYQYEYARRLGFERSRIFFGLYSANTQHFEIAYQKYREGKSKEFPRTLLYVGRYVDLKGIDELYTAFRELQKEGNFNWKLKMVGAGPLRDKFKEGNGIEIMDFIQPEKLPELAKESGAFVLPSRHEPWGVVLHEFAAAGMPLIASDACGAATVFVHHGYNGFMHNAASKDSLKEALRQINKLSDEELMLMGDRSVTLSKMFNPEIWAATLHHIAGGT